MIVDTEIVGNRTVGRSDDEIYVIPRGGGVLATSTGLRIAQCTLSGNEGEVGGAIVHSGGTLVIEKSVLSGNSSADGGAVYLGSGIGHRCE